MNEPNIHSLMQAAVAGELGERTERRQVQGCPAEQPCREAIALDYEFDAWDGEDLVEAMGEYAVSERLRKAIEDAALKGVELRLMKTSKGEVFEISDNAYARELPRFHWMVITGSAEGPQIWSTSKPCAGCGRKIWDVTDAGLAAISSASSGRPGPVREVYRDSWKGDDLFYLPDRILPTVTQRFVDVLDQLNVKKVVLRPARWIDR